MSNKQLFQFLKFEVLLIAFLLGFAFLIDHFVDSLHLGLLVSCGIYFLWNWISFINFTNWLNADENTSPMLFGVWNYLWELELANQTKVRKTRAKYQQILKQLEITTKAFPEATILVNEKDRIEWSNDAAFSLMGISEKHKGLNIFKAIKSEEFKKFYQSSEETSVTLKHFKNDSITLDFKFINYSKKQRLLIARDVSQEQQLAKTRKSFVANASHELRTPLTVITGYLEILQEGDLQDMYQMPLSRAMEQAQRMNSIIDDLLELSKIEHSKTMQLDKEPINMAKLLTDLIHSLEALKEQKQATIVANFDSQLLVRGNEQQIHSLCENLVKNALIHNAEGVNVELFWGKNKHGQPRLCICDDGFGIPQEHLKHVTERFYRVENPEMEQVQGTGLGLAIVKHISKFHDAKLCIQSEPNQGVCFEILFPVERMID